MPKIGLSKRVRLTHVPVSADRKRWFVEDFASRRIWEVEPAQVAVLLGFAAPRSIDDVAHGLEQFGLDVDAVAAIAATFLDAGVLRLAERDTSNSIVRAGGWDSQSADKWSSLGWVAAQAYHHWCYDFPFLEHDVPGLTATREAMQEYSAEETDSERFKSYPEDLPRVHLPSAAAAARKLGSADDYERFKSVLSMSFGVTARIPAPWGGAPLALRMSPSGGARHPTEGYLIAVSEKTEEWYWYHIQVEPLALVLLQSCVPQAFVRHLFPRHFLDADFEIRWIVVLTSMFRRNMYRYREPRTFRSVHMDVGHLAENLRMLTEDARLESFFHFGVRARHLEKAMELDPTIETVQCAIAIGSNAGKTR